MSLHSRVVIDCKDHLLGRLASVVAKELLNGREVVLVRCEGVNISGHFIRNKLKYLSFIHKRTNYNPIHGPFHHRAPSAIMYRTVRGMVPHKTTRGEAAMNRLTCLNGCPAPFDKIKKLVVPEALRNLRLKPSRKFATLDRISHEIGWKHKEDIEQLEAKRLAAAQEWYTQKKKTTATFVKAVASDAQVQKIDAELAQYGF
eukprot:gnl/Dysnectes_brevis/354_a392_10278.p2 GENE.gnl/Dysnectes_brevis/354_a392_10278~~gnl/Dysnectes_brevis/354_a392_10278.p2  ORF type:complete len:201 (+),score=65.61 gnl/Dysnectes_brevis/354_a392_10278:51-653(+)